MKPVDQTIFGSPHGNCLLAAAASILEVPLSAIEPMTQYHYGRKGIVHAEDFILLLPHA